MRWQSLLVNRPGQFGPTMRIATLLLQDAEPSIIVHCILQSLHQRCKPPTHTLPSVKPTHYTDFTTLAHPTIPQPIFANRITSTINNTQTYLFKNTSRTTPLSVRMPPALHLKTHLDISYHPSTHPIFLADTAKLPKYPPKRPTPAQHPQTMPA